MSGFDDTVHASVVFDDGSGPALYVGGSFQYLDGVPVDSIAKWNGNTWSAVVDSSGNGTDGIVLTLAVHDDGTGPALFVGGFFTSAGGVTAQNIARWDGTAWSALSGAIGTGVNGTVTTLAAYDDGGGEELLIGGSFSTAGGVTANNIAGWDGSEFSALSGPSATGTSGEVRDLAVWDDGGGAKLYAAGFFTHAGGLTANRVAAWDGTQWSTLSGPSGTGTDGGVYTIEVFDDGGGEELYAAGQFGMAGGVAAWAIAKWDGSVWSDLGASGWGGTIITMEEFDGGLIAAGNLFLAGGVDVSNIAVWNGTTWADLSGPIDSGTDDMIWTLTVDDHGIDQDLYVGGDFGRAGGLVVNRVAHWDGIEWSPISAPGPSGAGIDSAVESLAVFDDGTGNALYAGGHFGRAGDEFTDYIAKWDGAVWTELGELSATGTNAGVFSLAVYDDGGGESLFAGGTFTSADSTEVNNVAGWDGSSWSALSGPSGTGTSGDAVEALAVHDDGSGESLFAGGFFLTAGGVTVNNIARWDDTMWSELSGPSGTGTSDRVIALAAYDDGGGEALYAGGLFLSAGGVTVNGIARWDGTSWSELSGSLGFGVDTYWVEALAVFDDGTGEALYVGGDFSTAGGVTANGIARWDGSEWSALSGPFGTGTDSQVWWIEVHDDGNGEALYVGGWFSSAGGVPANNIAKWDGLGWSALTGPSDTGTNNPVNAIEGFDDGNGIALFAGGAFTSTGGVPASRIGKWQCEVHLFVDGFESGNTSAWSNTNP